MERGEVHARLPLRILTMPNGCQEDLQFRLDPNEEDSLVVQPIFAVIMESHIVVEQKLAQRQFDDEMGQAMVEMKELSQRHRAF